MSKSIIGSFENRPAAEAAVQGLLSQGFSQNDISVLVTDKSKGRHFEIESGDKTSEGIGKGAVVGGALGGVVAGLTAIGAVASGGTILAAGPVVSALAGAGAGGATGGLLGGLIGLGIPEHEAKLSSEDVDKGCILIGVNAEDDRVQKTKEALEKCGAERITTQS